MKTLLHLFTLILTCGWAKAQDWQPIGSDFFNQPSTGYASAPSFAMDGEGHLYVSYWDYKGTYKATVRKYQDDKWGPVGPVGFSEDNVPAPIAVAPDGKVYAIGGVAGALVSRFNGTDWEAAGDLYPNVSGMNLAVAADGTPYLAVIDHDQADKSSVLKLSGNSWVTVGAAGFSEAPVGNITILIAPDGTPYVTCLVRSDGHKGTVMKFTDGTWQTVGQAGIREGAFNPSLAIGADGIPILAFSDSLKDYKATVVKFEGSGWQAVGEEGFSAGFAAPDIAVSDQGTLYVAYTDSTLGRRMIIKKFNGSSWETAGNAGFSNFDATSPSLIISHSGIPYVAYADRVTSVDEYLYKVRVMKLEGNTWKSVGSGGVSEGFGAATALAIAPDGTPYMVYTYDSMIAPDFQSWHKTKVVKWVNGSWKRAGATEYFKGIDNIRLAIAPDGTPYMAHKDSASNGQVSVVKLQGNDWETVGVTGSAENYTDFAIDSTGTPYLALMSNVLKFDGNEWKPVSATGFSANPVYTYMAIDKEGTLYVAYSDGTIGARTIAKKLVGSEWTDISSGFQAVEAYPILLSVDASDTLRIAFTLGGNTLVHFMKWNGSSWEGIKPYFTKGPPTSIAMDSKGTFYLSYMDESNNGKPLLVMFNGSEWIPVGNQDIIASSNILLKTDRTGNLYMIYNKGGIWAYKYEQGCTNPTDGGTIAENQFECSPFNVDIITSSASPSGYTGTLECKWQSSTTGSSSGFTDVMHTGETYDPGIITQTIWFRRLARVSCMPDWSGAAVSNVVKMTVETLPQLTCPANDNLFNDPGALTARKSYSALPTSTPDTLAVYMVDGKAITFPYDFPIGTTAVQVKANSPCATTIACFFTVTVKQVTGTQDLDAPKPSVDIYPNPFTRQMAIEIANPSHTEVSVEIFSVNGQKIKTLLKAQKEAKISLSWNGEDENGKKVPEGMYLLKVNGSARKVVKE